MSIIYRMSDHKEFKKVYIATTEQEAKNMIKEYIKGEGITKYRYSQRVMDLFLEPVIYSMIDSHHVSVSVSEELTKLWKTDIIFQHLTSPLYSGNDIDAYESETLPYEEYIAPGVNWCIALVKNENKNRGYYLYKRKTR